MKHVSISVLAIVISIVLIGLIHSSDVQASRDQNVDVARKTAVAGQKSPGIIRRGASGQGIFVVSNLNGRMVCRIATPDEAKQMLQRNPNFPLHAITPASKTRAAITGSVTPQAQTGLSIILMGTDQLEGFPDAKKAFIRAASHWEALIQTPITIILDVDFGPTAFGTPFGTNVIGSTDTQTLVDSPVTPTPTQPNPHGYVGDLRPALVASGTTQESQIYSQLPVSSVPADIGSATTFVAPSANFRALGLLDAMADPALDYSNGLGTPPAIGFNSTTAFDFDPSDGIDSDKVDFDAVVTHEIGHALGFASEVGDHALNPTDPIAVTPWDLFRFRSGTTLNTFQTATRILSPGGDQEFFNGTNDTPVSTGDPNGNGGDGWQASHWKDDVQTAAIRPYLGIMHPVVAPGSRNLITDNDLKVLDLIGYTLATNTQPTDELSADDGTAETGGVGSNAILVNRLTPSNYPSTLQKIRVFIRPVNGQPSPAGTRLRILAYTAATQGSFTGSSNPRPLVDQNILLPDPGAGSFVDLNLPLGPTINSGDWYVGFQFPTSSNVAVGEDTSSASQQRGFISNDNGNSFSANGLNLNLMLHAVETSSGCLFSLSSSAQSFDKTGGQGSFNVTANPGCSWSPQITEQWISSSSSGTGNGTVQFTVQPNAQTVARTTVIMIGDQSFTITENAGDLLSTQNTNITLGRALVEEQCVMQPAASQLQIAVPSNAFQVEVDLDGGNADVDLYVKFNSAISVIPSADGPFVADFSSTSPSGQESVIINTFSNPTLQAGTYFIGVANCENVAVAATLTVTITGSAGQTCTFTVTPGTLAFPATGGQSSANVVVQNGCSWVASSSDTSWLNITSGASGSGNGTVNYTASPNPSQVARSATLTVAGQNFNVTEDAAPKQDQTITFNPIPDKTFGDAPFIIAATASSQLPVSFSVISTNGAIFLTTDLSGNTFVNIATAGQATVRASQAGNSAFNAAPNVDRTFTINKENQTISFGPIPNHTFGDPQFFLSATASSGLTVTFSVTSGPAVLSGNGVTITGAGQITIEADQTGNANFNAAAPVMQSFTVAKANQTITFGSLANHTFGDAPFTISATASSGLTVAFTVFSGPATINGNTVTLTGIGTVIIEADQSGDANHNAATPVQQSFTVGKAVASINLSNVVQIFNGSPRSASVTTTPPGLSGLTVTYNGNTTAPTAVGNYALVASLNNANFQANNATATFRIIAFSSTNSTSVNPGNQGTASALPDPCPCVTADLTHSATGVAATVSVGVYSDNPTEAGVVNAGGGFVDVKVVQANDNDSLLVNYYYSSSVTGANETALQLFFFNGTNWQLVSGSGGSAPVKDTTDNLDGTVSGGRFTVTLDNTSSPKVSGLTGTPFAATTAVMGDLNGDGQVTVSDLVLLANAIAGNITLSSVQKAAADVSQDGSGQITITDLVTMANFLAGNIRTIPVISSP